MLDALLELLGGETTALLIWAAAGAILATALWVVMIVWAKGRLPMRTEKAADGTTRTGALRWLLVFVIALTWLPLGKLALRAVAGVAALFTELYYTVNSAGGWVLRHWWLFVLLGLGYGLWRASRNPRVTDALREWRAARRQPPAPVEAPPLPHDPIPHAPPIPRQGLPVGVGQDGTLRYPPPPANPPAVPDDFWARPTANR